jgi:hypothetical protein
LLKRIDMKSIVELIEYSFGATLDTKFVHMLRQGKLLNTDVTEDFMTSLLDLTDHPFIPERRDGELRAFVGYTYSDANMVFYDVDRNGVDLNYFKRLLLYYDRVALTIHTEFFFERRRDPSAVIGLVDLVNSMKPLVEQNIMNFVNETILYNSTKSFRRSYQNLTGKAFPNQNSYYFDSGYRVKREYPILEDLNACHSIDFDYVTTLESNWSEIKGWYINAPKFAVEKEAQHLWANSLITFDLPNLTNLTYDDIISIRQNSDAFYEWRRNLNELFELLAKNTPSTVLDISKEVQYFSKHSVAEKRRKLEEEIRTSSLQSHLKTGLLIITVSFLGQLLASQFIDIPLTRQLITLLAGSSGAASLVPLFQKQKGKRKNKLLAKYYSLLEEAS